jgi:hypothetical protein
MAPVHSEGYTYLYKETSKILFSAITFWSTSLPPIGLLLIGAPDEKRLPSVSSQPRTSPCDYVRITFRRMR